MNEFGVYRVFSNKQLTWITNLNNLQRLTYIYLFHWPLQILCIRRNVYRFRNPPHQLSKHLTTLWQSIDPIQTMPELAVYVHKSLLYNHGLKVYNRTGDRASIVKKLKPTAAILECPPEEYSGATEKKRRRTVKPTN